MKYRTSRYLECFLAALLASAAGLAIIRFIEMKDYPPRQTNTVTLTNYVTVTNVVSAKWKCPHHDNPWHETTENCPDYEK